jgi:porin
MLLIVGGVGSALANDIVITAAASEDELGLGPSSVPSQLEDADEAREGDHPGWPSLPSLDQYNLSIAADYSLLFQQISRSPGEKSAAGGVARFFGTWRPNPDSRSPGRLIFKIEHRHDLGTEIAPQQLLFEAGVAGISGPTFGNKRAVLTNLYWGQSFADNSIRLVAGVVDVADYIDVYGLLDVWTEFNNLAFSTNPTMPVPSQGLGAAAGWRSPSRFYVLGSIADANGDPHRPQDSVDNFFGTAEYFKHVEFGRFGSFDNRWADNTHVTFWQVDEREEAAVAKDWGMTLSWSRQRGRWLPFARAGYADRGVALLQKMSSVGTGYSVNDGRDYIGAGINWGQAEAGERNQYTAEAYYKWQLFNHVLIVGGLQYIANPAYDSEEDSLWLGSIKVRTTF